MQHLCVSLFIVTATGASAMPAAPPRWAPTPPLPAARWQHAIATSKLAVAAFGGWDEAGGALASTVSWYLPDWETKRLWTSVAGMTAARRHRTSSNPHVPRDARAPARVPRERYF